MTAAALHCHQSVYTYVVIVNVVVVVVQPAWSSLASWQHFATSKLIHSFLSVQACFSIKRMYALQQQVQQLPAHSMWMKK